MKGNVTLEFGEWIITHACASPECKNDGDLKPIEDLFKIYTEKFCPDTKEYIICAANYYNDGRSDHGFEPNNIKIGFVVCGRRHHNCIHTFAQIVGFPYTEEGQKIHLTEIQGFVTNTNRFVGRKEAYKIAFEANQIIGPNKGYPENNIGLTSEDLY